jgi:hypothetical protein
MMSQGILNLIIAGFGTLMGFTLHAMWQSVKDLQKADKLLVAKVSSIEVLVAGEYPKREELDKLSTALFKKLDRIEAKLDHKADK